MKRDVSWISDARFAPYLEGSGGDVEAAWSLYEWNARVSSALTECIHHTEVLVRNAMMRELEKVHPLDYPWRDSHDQVEKAAAKLKKKNSGRSVTPDAIIASVTLGFWATFLHDSSQNEELWRKCLRQSFPNSSGVRGQVDRAVSDMLELRNRCAHQDSLLSLDPSLNSRRFLHLPNGLTRMLGNGLARSSRFAIYVIGGPYRRRLTRLSWGQRTARSMISILLSPRTYALLTVLWRLLSMSDSTSERRYALILRMWNPCESIRCGIRRRCRDCEDQWMQLIIDCRG